MTKKEREQICKAMDLMWNQEDTIGALVILKKLVGMDTTIEEIWQNAPAEDPFEFLKRDHLFVRVKAEHSVSEG